MKIKYLLVILIVSTLYISCRTNHNLKARVLEGAAETLTITTSPITVADEGDSTHKFTITSSSSEEQHKINALSSVVITDNSDPSNTITCTSEGPECLIDISNEPVSFSLKVESDKEYSITSIIYTVEGSSQPLVTLTGNEFKFKVNADTQPTFDKYVLAKENDVTLSFTFVDLTKVTSMKIDGVQCNKNDGETNVFNCAHSIGNQVISVMTLIDGIYYDNGEIEIIKYSTASENNCYSQSDGIVFTLTSGKDNTLQNSIIKYNINGEQFDKLIGEPSNENIQRKYNYKLSNPINNGEFSDFTLVRETGEVKKEYPIDTTKRNIYVNSITAFEGTLKIGVSSELTFTFKNEIANNDINSIILKENDSEPESTVPNEVDSCSIVEVVGEGVHNQMKCSYLIEEATEIKTYIPLFTTKCGYTSTSSSVMINSKLNKPIITNFEPPSFKTGQTNNELTITFDETISTAPASISLQISGVEKYNIPFSALDASSNSIKVDLGELTEIGAFSITIKFTEDYSNTLENKYLLIYTNDLTISPKTLTLPRYDNQQYSVLYIPLANEIITEQINTVTCPSIEVSSPKLGDDKKSIEVTLQSELTIEESTTVVCTVNGDKTFTINFGSPVTFSIDPHLIIGKESKSFNIKEESNTNSISISSIQFSNSTEIIYNNGNNQYEHTFTPDVTSELTFKYIVGGYYEYEIPDLKLIVNVNEYNELFNNPFPSCHLLPAIYSLDYTLKDGISSIISNDAMNFKIMKEGSEVTELSQGSYTVNVFSNNDDTIPFYSHSMTAFNPAISSPLYISTANKISFSIESALCQPSLSLKKTEPETEIPITCEFITQEGEETNTLECNSDDVQTPSEKIGTYALNNGLIEVKNTIDVYMALDAVTDLKITMPSSIVAENNKITIETKQYDLNNIQSITFTKTALGGTTLAEDETQLIISKTDEPNPFTVTEKYTLEFSINVNENIEYQMVSITDGKLTKTLDEQPFSLSQLPTYEVTNPLIYFTDESKPIDILLKITLNGNTIDNTEDLSVTLKGITSICKYSAEGSTEDIYNYKCPYTPSTSETISLTPSKDIDLSIQFIKYTFEKKCVSLPFGDKKSISITLIKESEASFSLTGYLNSLTGTTSNDDNNNFIITFDISLLTAGTYPITISKDSETAIPLNGESVTILAENSIQTITQTTIGLPTNVLSLTIAFTNSLAGEISNMKLVKKDDNSKTIELDCGSGTKDQSSITCQYDNTLSADKVGTYTLSYVVAGCEQTGSTDITLNQNAFTISVTEPIVLGENTLKITKAGDFDLSSITEVKLTKTTISEGKEETEDITYCKTPTEGDGNSCKEKLPDPSDDTMTFLLTLSETVKSYSLLSIKHGAESTETTVTYQPNEYVISDFTINKDLIVLKDGTTNASTEIIIDFKGLNLVKEIIDNCERGSTDGTMATFSCDISEIPTDLEIKSMGGGIVHTINVIKYSDNDKTCSIANSEDDKIELTFTSSSSVSFNVYINEETSGKAINLSDESYTLKESFIFSSEGKSQLYSQKIGSSNEKQLIEGIEITVHKKISINTSSLSKEGDNSFLLTLDIPSIENGDISKVELMTKNEQDEYVSEFSCKAEDNTLTLEKDKAKCTITGEVSAETTYYIFYTNACGRSVNSEKDVQYSPITSTITFEKEPNTCNYYLDNSFSVSISYDSSIQQNEYEKYNIYCVDKASSETFTSFSLQTSDHITFTIPNDKQNKLKGKTVTIMIVQGDDTDNPIESKDIVFTDLIYDLSYSYKDKPFIINSSCQLPSSSQLSLTSGNTPISFTDCQYDNNKLTCTYPNGLNTFGLYNLKINGETIKENIFISDSILDTEFNIILSPELTDGKNTVTITNPNFYIPTISGVTITKDGEELKNESDYTFDNSNNVITISIALESDKQYYITKITREKESDEDENVEVSQELKEPFLLEIKGFTVNNPYVFIEKSKDAVFTITSTVAVSYYITPDAAHTNCEQGVETNTYLCTISGITEPTKITFINSNNNSQNGYIYIYSFEENTNFCQVISKDTDTLFSFTISEPLDTPISIDKSKISFSDCTIDDANNKYSVKYNANSKLPLHPKVEIAIGNGVSLDKEFSFYSAIQIEKVDSLLLENKANQDIMITFSEIDEEQDIKIKLASAEKEVQSKSSECNKVDDKQYICSLDLSTIPAGIDYQIIYTSPCGDEIDLKESITVFSMENLPIEVNLEKEYEIGDKVDIKNTDEDNYPTIVFYYKSKNSVEDYKSIDTPIESLGEYEIFYALTEDFSKTMIGSFEVKGDITIEPFPNSCYYIKEVPSFTLSTSSYYAVLVDEENNEYPLIMKGNTVTLQLTDDKTINAGSYTFIIRQTKESLKKLYSASITFTDITLEKSYYLSEMVFSSLLCVPSTIQVNYGTGMKTALTCDEELEDETLKCEYPKEEIEKYGNYNFYTGDSLIGTAFISNSIKNAHFAIVNPSEIVANKELTYYLTSTDFYLELISSLTYTIKKKEEKTPGEEKSLELKFIESNNTMSFVLKIEDLNNEYKASDIISKEGESKSINHVLSEQRSCKGGLLMLPNGVCVLPDEELEDNTIDKCKDYCVNGGSCSLKGNVPKCTCPEGYFGMKCELTNTNATTIITESINSIFTPSDTETENKIIDLNEPDTVIQIQSISTVISQDKNMIDEIKENERQNIFKSTMNTLKEELGKAEKKIKPNKHSIKLLALSLKIEVFKILKSLKLRNLQSSQSNLKELIGKAKELNEAKARTMSPDEQYLTSQEDDLITYQTYKNTKEGKQLYSKDSLEKNTPIVYLSNCQGISEDYIISHATYGSDIQKALGKEKPSDSVETYIFNGIDTNNKMSNCLPFSVEMTLSSSMNVELFKYYQDRGIDIYNPNDKAFTEPCYISKNFDYDLTQKYRRKNLYQGYTFKGPDGCYYDHFNVVNQRVNFYCNTTVNEDMLYTMTPISLEDKKIKVNHVDNLPTKCGGDVEDIEENIAFWLFLIFFIVFIIFDVILAVGSCSKLANTNIALMNDELDIGEFRHVPKATEQAKLDTEDNAVKTEEIQVSIPADKSFGTIFCNNFKALHPLLSMCHQSIFSPMIFTSWVFLYNLLNLFGFNALYFNETMLEDRIYDKHRDNFGYPMKTEFEKIMAAISTCIALTIVVRLITLVTYSMKEKLMQQLQTNKATEQVIGEFTKSMLVRRIIAGVFMLALNVFFFYYCIVFCGMYVNAQYGWFYSGIWSLIFNWVAYAPLYILIISIVESSGKDSCAYYMKRLFVF